MLNATLAGTTGAVGYDSWGRTTTLPKQASGGGLSVVSDYFSNDLARRIQNGTVTSINTLDPLRRIRTRETETTGQSTVPRETYRYGDDGDSPTFTTSATRAAPSTTTGWVRFAEDPTGDFAMQVTGSGSKTLQLASVRGDTVAEAPLTTAATGFTASFPVDEFGVPTGATMGQRKYGFLGTEQRESLLYGNVVAMGARAYSPHSGRFLQVDPVQPAGPNPYDYVGQDPVNHRDLGGRDWDDWQGGQIVNARTWRSQAYRLPVYKIHKVCVWTITGRRCVEDGAVQTGQQNYILSVTINDATSVEAKQQVWVTGDGVSVQRNSVGCRQDITAATDRDCEVISGSAGETGSKGNFYGNVGRFFFTFGWEVFAAPNAVGDKTGELQSARFKCSFGKAPKCWWPKR